MTDQEYEAMRVREGRGILPTTKELRAVCQRVRERQLHAAETQGWSYEGAEAAAVARRAAIDSWRKEFELPAGEEGPSRVIRNDSRMMAFDEVALPSCTCQPGGNDSDVNPVRCPTCRLPGVAEGKLGWARTNVNGFLFAFYREGAGRMAYPVFHTCGTCLVRVGDVTGPAIMDVDPAGCQCRILTNDTVWEIKPIEAGPAVDAGAPCSPAAPEGVEYVYQIMASGLDGLQRAGKEGYLTDEAALEVQSWLDAIERRVEKLRAREKTP